MLPELSASTHVAAVLGLQCHVCLDGARQFRRRRRQNESAPVGTTHANDTSGFQDSAKLAQRRYRIGQMLHQRMAEYPVESAALERQRVSIASLESDVAASPPCCSSPRTFDLGLREINPYDITRRDAGRNPHGDRSGTAAAIQYRQPRPEVRQKECPVRLKSSLGHEIRGIFGMARRVDFRTQGVALFMAPNVRVLPRGARGVAASLTRNLPPISLTPRS